MHYLIINMLREFQDRTRTLLLLFVAAFLPGFLLTQYVSAHPLGNFSVNRYSRLELSQKLIRIHYVVDMAEIPALQERGLIDTNRDGTISDEECDRYLAAKTKKLSESLDLVINGENASLKMISKELTFPPGQGGLLTQRLTMTLETSMAPFSKDKPWELDYNDHNYSDRLGWKEIIAQSFQDVELLESNIPKQDKSDELRKYPKELLYKPLEVQNARLQFVPNADASIVSDKKAMRSGTIIHAEDRFSKLITTQNLTLPVVLIALFVAMGLGAMHSFSPGHGKTIVAAYLVGSRGTPRHALFLGATVTLTHTIGVFALGLVTLFASRYVLPEQLYPWLGTLSGLIVVGIGAMLFVRRLIILLNGNSHSHHHNHGNSHDSYDHTHEQEEHNNHVNDHHHSDERDRHSHLHSHNNNPHAHSHDLHYHENDFSVGHHHDNDPHHHGHSHLSHGMDGSPVTWRSLLALGISGGILPCPSALVVLLGAISLHRVGFGLILIIAFSIGLAGVLTGIGLLFLKGRQMLSRFGMTSPMLRFLPVGSAIFITFLGIGITLNALRQFVN